MANACNRLAQFRSNLSRGAATLALFATAQLFSGSVVAETAAIHLNDGTTVRGEVVGLKGGSYQIRSSSLGELNIPQSKIKLVEFNPGAVQANATTPASQSGDLLSNNTNANTAAATLSNITSRLQNSPALMGDIQSLTNDPDIMAIVQDPEIQRLISAGDYSALMQNSKMRRLMGNSKIGSVTSQLK